MDYAKTTSARNYKKQIRCLPPKKPVLIVILLGFFVLFWMIQVNANPKLQLDQVVIHSAPSTEKLFSPRILVAFTGPLKSKDNDHIELHVRNTDHFLKYGVQCHDRDTIIAVGVQYYDHYYPIVKAIRDSRCSNGHFVHLISRRTFCLDMETLRMIVSGSVAGVNWDDYDYFVSINCEVTGPHPQFQYSWLQIYLSKLKPPVHMTGLSVNCDPAVGVHVQSMLYALDRVGMDFIQSIPYDCTVDSNGALVQGSADDLNSQVNVRYEVGMSQRLLEKGYSIAPATLQSGMVVAQDTKCNFTDIWYPAIFQQIHGGTLPLWNETIFWKSTRFLNPEIKETIGYGG